MLAEEIWNETNLFSRKKKVYITDSFAVVFFVVLRCFYLQIYLQEPAQDWIF